MQTKTTSATYKADQGQGIFEALVAVFDNVDRGGDRIRRGAFVGSLARWKKRGRPIPVVYSHDWGNPDALIGKVLEAAENDRGLWVKGQLDLAEDFAAKVFRRMQAGTLAEFSFAYDVIDSKQVKDETGQTVNELRELEIFEVGPTLVGMNPATELLAVKAKVDRDGAAQAARELLGMSQKQSWRPRDVLRAIEAMGDDVKSPRAVLAKINRLQADSLTPAGVKRSVSEMWPWNPRDVRLHSAMLGCKSDRMRWLIAEGVDETDDLSQHSQAWIDAMMEAEIDGMARRLAQAEPAFGGNVWAARAFVVQQLNAVV